MKSELIVDVQSKEVSFALLEDSRLVSLQKEARDMAFAVGDIYLAKVKKLMPGLNAAFVNVGFEKDAFLHYLDLGPQFASYEAYLSRLLGSDRSSVPALEEMTLLPPIDKHGSIADTIKPGQELLVQIVKEPISSKGPRLTTELTFTGRFMVLIPFSDKISISQKIKSQEEKMRLRKLIESIKPANFGVIVRTSAEGKRVAELISELKSLVNCWHETVAKAQKATAPELIYQEESRIVGMLRDVFSPSFEAIHVNDVEVHEQIDRYVRLIAPETKDIVHLYQKDAPIFDHFGITRQIKSSFGKTVSFRSGAYIIIESTEALHVVDVNSGNRTKGAMDQESNALEVNMRAAEEIARQLRLRDMGGIIVVDFIDMAKGEHRQQLFEHMREIMAHDRARHNILPLSKFGLMQITRQRVRPALSITTVENCPSCFGKGEVQPSLLFTDTLNEKLDYVINTLGLRDFVMYIHPFVDAYVKRGIFTSLYGKWRRKYGRVFRILPDESLAYLQYKVLDKDRNEIDLKEEKDMNASSASKTANKARNRGDAPENLSDLEIAESAVPAAEAAPLPVSQTDAESDGNKKKRRRKKKSSQQVKVADESATTIDTYEAVAAHEVSAEADEEHDTIFDSVEVFRDEETSEEPIRAELEIPELESQSESDNTTVSLSTLEVSKTVEQVKVEVSDAAEQKVADKAPKKKKTTRRKTKKAEDSTTALEPSPEVPVEAAPDAAVNEVAETSSVTEEPAKTKAKVAKRKSSTRKKKPTKEETNETPVSSETTNDNVPDVDSGIVSGDAQEAPAEEVVAQTKSKTPAKRKPRKKATTKTDSPAEPTPSIPIPRSENED